MLIKVCFIDINFFLWNEICYIFVFFDKKMVLCEYCKIFIKCIMIYDVFFSICWYEMWFVIDFESVFVKVFNELVVYVFIGLGYIFNFF